MTCERIYEVQGYCSISGCQLIKVSWQNIYDVL
jgi:hypothetical protein